jgi:hypothetical protein
MGRFPLHVGSDSRSHTSSLVLSTRSRYGSTRFDDRLRHVHEVRMQVRIASPRIPVIKRCGNHAREWRHDGCRHNRCKWRPRDSRRIPAHLRQLADGLVKSTHACAGHSSPTAALSDFGTVNVAHPRICPWRRVGRAAARDWITAGIQLGQRLLDQSRPNDDAGTVVELAPSTSPNGSSIRTRNSSHMSSKRRRRPTRRGCGTQFGWVAGTLAETCSR